MNKWNIHTNAKIHSHVCCARMSDHREIQEIKIINCESGFFSFYTHAHTHTRLIFVFSLFLLLSGDYYNLYIAIQSDSFNGECLSWHSITRPYCLCHFYFLCYVMLLVCVLLPLLLLFHLFSYLLYSHLSIIKKCVRTTTFQIAKKERSICLVQYWQRMLVCRVHTLTTATVSCDLQARFEPHLKSTSTYRITCVLCTHQQSTH